MWLQHETLMMGEVCLVRHIHGRRGAPLHSGSRYVRATEALLAYKIHFIPVVKQR